VWVWGGGTYSSDMRNQSIFTPEFFTAFGAGKVALAFDQVDEFGFEGGEVEVAFSAVFVEEGGGFVPDEEAVGWEGALVTGRVGACVCWLEGIWCSKWI
jgi:hypothetical protein